MEIESKVKCPDCGSINVVAADADWFKKYKEQPLVLFLLGTGFVCALFACFAIAKMGYFSIAVLLFIFFTIGFIAQHFIRSYLDKRMITTYFCQDCHQSWSK